MRVVRRCAPTLGGPTAQDHVGPHGTETLCCNGTMQRGDSTCCRPERHLRRPRQHARSIPDTNHGHQSVNTKRKQPRRFIHPQRDGIIRRSTQCLFCLLSAASSLSRCVHGGPAARRSTGNASDYNPARTPSIITMLRATRIVPCPSRPTNEPVAQEIMYRTLRRASRDALRHILSANRQGARRRNWMVRAQTK